MEVVEVCCKYGMSNAKDYKWIPLRHGMAVSAAERLKAREAENRKPRTFTPRAVLRLQGFAYVEGQEVEVLG